MEPGIGVALTVSFQTKAGQPSVGNAPSLDFLQGSWPERTSANPGFYEYV